MMGAHKLISKGAAMYDDITRIPLIVRRRKGSGDRSIRQSVISIYCRQ
ncbi:hypothetical protein ACLB1O_24435 [Escherichia coli]